MAWTFLYAASHQVFDPQFTVAGFLKGTKTFHDVYAPLTNPSWAPVITFLVAYGHLLIGLSLTTTCHCLIGVASMMLPPGNPMRPYVILVLTVVEYRILNRRAEAVSG